MNPGRAPAFAAHVVALDHGDGLVGSGEVEMVGAFYSEAFAAGALAGIGELAPLLIGLDATRPRALLDVLDRTMRGQEYVKSALDMAAWDAAGKAAGLPLCDLLGGRLGTSVALYDVVTAGTPDERVPAMAEELLGEGYGRIRVKVGGDRERDAGCLRQLREGVGPDVVLFADANGCFSAADARRFLRATRDLDYTLEQPCRTYADCAAIRGACDRPLVLDESLEHLDDLLRARADGVADGVTIKVGRVGGVTRALLLRDVACALDLHVTVEDIGGASLATAAFIHLGLGVPDRLRLHTVDYHRWFTADNGSGLPPAVDGAQAAPDGPGLGIAVDLDALGTPVLDLGATP